MRRGEHLLSETPKRGSREEAVLEGAAGEGKSPRAGQKAVWVVLEGSCGHPVDNVPRRALEADMLEDAGGIEPRLPGHRRSRPPVWTAWTLSGLFH
jgi:hypothetical protein